jgi:hypothetical protein
MLLCNSYVTGQSPSGSSVTKRFTAKRLDSDNDGAVYDNVFLNPKYNRQYYEVTNYLNFDPDSATIVIKVGSLPSGMSMHSVKIEYLTLPQHIVVTDDDLYGTGDDNSQQLEFLESFRSKFISSVTESLLEYANNPRIQTLPPLSQDIPQVPVELLTGNPAANNNQQ